MAIIYTPPAPVVPVTGADNGLTLNTATKNIELGGDLDRVTQVFTESNPFYLGESSGSTFFELDGTTGHIDLQAGINLGFIQMRPNQTYIQGKTGDISAFLDLQTVLQLSRISFFGNLGITMSDSGFVITDQLLLQGITYGGNYTPSGGNGVPNVTHVNSLIASGLVGYATTSAVSSAITTALIPYATTAAVTAAISAALAPYATTASVTAAIAAALVPYLLASQAMFLKVGFNELLAQTTAQTVMSIIVPASDTYYTVNGWIDVTSFTAGSASLMLNYTDPQNVARSATFTGPLTSLGPGFAASRFLKVKAGTVFSFTTTVTGTLVYDVGVTIEIKN